MRAAGRGVCSHTAAVVLLFLYPNKPCFWHYLENCFVQSTSWRKRIWINRKSKSQLIFLRNVTLWIPNVRYHELYIAWSFCHCWWEEKRESCAFSCRFLGHWIFSFISIDTSGELFEGKLCPYAGLRLMAGWWVGLGTSVYSFVRKWQRLADNQLHFLLVLSNLSWGSLVGCVNK